MNFAAIRVNQILSNFILARGFTPGVTDLQRPDAYPILLAQAQDVSGGVAFAQIVSSTTMASFTAEAAFTAATPADVQFTFPASSLVAGSVVRFTAWGTLATTGTPTFTLGARLGGIGGQLIAATGAMTAANNSTAAPWRLQGQFTVRQGGATGIIAVGGNYGSLVNTTAAAGALIIHGGLSPVTGATIVLTSALTLVFTAACSASDPANTIVMTGSTVEVF